MVVFKAFILDLDGVIYLDRQPIPGAPEAVHRLQRRGEVFFLSNDATKHRLSYLKLFKMMGISTDVSHLYTSGYGAAVHLSRNRPSARVFPIGERGLKQELLEQGLEPLPLTDSHPAEAVVVAKDRFFTYRKLHKAVEEILYHQAEFIATNKDHVYPLPGGRVEPGGGSIVAAVETAVAHPPLLIGKPSPFLFQLIFETHGLSPEETLVVGDRLDTDIEGGRRAGAHTALVLSGLTQPDVLPALIPSSTPDFVAKDIESLVKEVL